MADEWFRRSTWSAQDESEFFARLKRSRTNFHKAQYLRIQAGTLVQAGLHIAAMQLFDRLLKEYPDSTQLAIAYRQIGECAEFMNQPERALEAYRNALEQQIRFPGSLTNAHISMAILVVKRKLEAHYDEALAALSKWERPGEFPITDFQISAARAIIYSARKERTLAAESAKKALAAALRTRSGFRYHANLGLVGDSHSELLGQMEIFSQNPPSTG